MTRAHQFSRLAEEKLFEVFDSFSEDTTPEDAGEASDSEEVEEGKDGGTKESS